MGAVMMSVVEFYLFIGVIFLLIAWVKGIIVNWHEIVYCLLAWPFMVYVMAAKK